MPASTLSTPTPILLLLLLAAACAPAADALSCGNRTANGTSGLFEFGGAETSWRRYAHCVELSSTYVLYWNASATDLSVGVAAVASGWVGIGLSPAGGMRGADIVVARVDAASGGVLLEDMFAEDFVRPTRDASQDVELDMYHQGASLTHVAFSRKLQVCDARDVTVEDRIMDVVFAVGDSHTFEQHGAGIGARGNGQVHFLRGASQPAAAASASGELTLRVQMPNATIPADRTTYLCVPVALPADKEYHVVGFDPIVRQPAQVHHMILFSCSALVTRAAPFSCRGMPAECVQFWLGWAVGGGRYDYPVEAGLAMGPGAQSTRFALLQVHYDNPLAVAGLEDDSGFALRYTATRRANDIGTMTLGKPFWWMTIPAGSPAYEVTNECPSQCTSKLPVDGVHVIGNNLHMHQTGSKMWVQHVRGDKELPPVGGRLDYYDFNFQASRPAASTLLPGDRLITHCVYDTLGLATDVKGGDGSDEEMCFAFLHYWPRQTFDMCVDLKGYMAGLDSVAVCTTFQAVVTQDYDTILADGLKVFKRSDAYTPFDAYAECRAASPAAAGARAHALPTLLLLLGAALLAGAWT